MGTRWHTLSALIERIEAAFIADYVGQSDLLAQADTPAKRYTLIHDTAEYVLAVESIQLSRQELAEVISQVYSNLFGYGPLDELFQDERVTTIALEGADKASVRYGHDELVTLDPLFRDSRHLRQIVERLLFDAGAELREDQPFVEAGLFVGKRPVCVNLLAPPVAFYLTVDIRVHPSVAPTMDDLVEQDFMSAQAKQLLEAMVQSSHGLMIVGDGESGKTTLLNALLQLLPTDAKIVTIERAGELRPPSAVERFVTQWPVRDVEGRTFGEQIDRGLEQQPAHLILDEVRSDEPESIAPLLQHENAPRQIWAFRGPSFAKRLASALGMLARRADISQSEAMVHALYARLPYVITVRRSQGKLQLHTVSEWQYHDSEYPAFVALMEHEDGVLRPTGRRPVHTLDLPDDFWNA